MCAEGEHTSLKAMRKKYGAKRAREEAREEKNRTKEESCGESPAAKVRKPNSPTTQAAIELVSKAKSESEQSERNLAAQSALNMAESLKDAKKTSLKRVPQVKKNASGMKGYTGYAIRTDEEARAAEEEAHGPRNWRTAEEFADLRYNQQELPLAARQRAAVDESRRNRLSRAEAGAWRGRTQAKVGNLIDLTDEEDDSRRPSRSQSTKDLPVIQETAAEVSDGQCNEAAGIARHFGT